jgi:hypothetical protein
MFVIIKMPGARCYSPDTRKQCATFNWDLGHGTQLTWVKVNTSYHLKFNLTGDVIIEEIINLLWSCILASACEFLRGKKGKKE